MRPTAGGEAEVRSVVIADVDGHLVARPFANELAHHLRRAGSNVITCDRAGDGTPGTATVSGAVRRLPSSPGDRPALVLFGDMVGQRRLVWGLALAGLLPHVRLVVHTDAARIPFEPSSAEVFARADVVVAESKFGSRAVRRCCAEAHEPPPEIVTTPPVLPSPSSLPSRTPPSRRAVRRERIGVGDDVLVVGCWVRDEQEEHQLLPLARSIFGQFTQGEYWRCGSCDHLTAWPLDDHLRPMPRKQCERCGLSNGAVGRSRDDTHLLVAPEPGAWEGDAVALWTGVDVHLQPHMLADVTVPMRVSCALRVPIVATRYAAVEEQLTDAARLVEPRMVLDDSAGHRTALIDRGSALAELCHLADDRATRRQAASDVGRLAHRWGTDRLLEQWTELLDPPART